MSLLVALKNFAIDLLKYWKQILFLVIFGATLYAAHEYGVQTTTQKYENIIKEANEKDAKAHEEFIKDKQFIAEAFEKWRATHPVIKEVKVYVDKVSDSNCVIPVGFVRVHDSAAKNEQVGGASELDGTASGINLSEVTQVIASNYESCNLDKKKLESLQEVVKAYQESQK